MTTTLLMTPSTIWRHRAQDSDKVTKKSPSSKDSGSRNGRHVKAWTADEERILLQDRVDRVPYRQIAARLGKSDLACRLHFHQMLMAKKTPQPQPGRSIGFLPSDHPPEIHHPKPAATTSGVQCAFSYLPNAGGDRGSDIMATALPLFQEPPVHRRSASCLCRYAANYPAQRPAISPYSPPRRLDDGTVDLSRFSHIYREPAGDSWSTAAIKYSESERLPPIELENGFIDARAANGGFFERPSTDIIPERSASVPVSRKTSVDMSRLQHIRSSSSMSIAGKCSVESLLNHGQV